MFDWIISSAEHELTTAQRKHWWDFTNAKLASLTRGFPDVPRSRFLFFFLQKVQEKGKWKWRPAPPRVPARSGPSGGLTAVQHVLVLGSSFTMSAICHIAPRLPGNYSSNPKWQRYLICTPAGREWTQQSQLALCWIPKSTRSLGRPGGFEHRSARADKRTIRPYFSHRPVLFLSAEETDLILKAERADKSLMVVRF